MSTRYLNRGIILMTNCCKDWEKTMEKDTYERCVQLEKLRIKILQAEEERLNGSKTYSISEAGKRLRKRYAEKN